MNNDHPLILVFYFQRDLFQEPEIIRQISDGIEASLQNKNAHAIAYMLPTDGSERIECINPVQISEPEMDKIMELVNDLKKQNDIKDE